MIRTVTGLDLGDAIFGSDSRTVGRGGDVAVPERIADGAPLVLKALQLILKPSQLSLIRCERVVRHEMHKSLRSADARKVRRTVDRMEAGIDQIWRITDVVQDRSRFQQLSIRTRYGTQRPCLPSDTLHVLPATRQSVGQLRR
ncbi:hypothetical protein ACZ91_38495 [Streptomyces regensis]|nr:hypothetical protein ACZ91_38495 [Streptomyces regensis]